MTGYIQQVQQRATAKDNAKRAALEKEKKQIKEAFDFGDYCVELPLNEREGDYTWGKKYKSAEEYYNQTYNQNK